MNKKIERLKIFLQKYGAYLAFLVALTAMLGSLYFSEVAGFVPCTFCWYQRILMYPLTIITLVGIIEQDEFLFNYVLPLSIIGIGFSSYHYLLQLGIFGLSNGCTIGIPCNLRYVNYFGFITIPFMALTAFILITLIMLGFKTASFYEPA
jgi:disulfide bond formation protein DsbB